MLKSCSEGYLLHSPLGQKHGGMLVLSKSTSTGSRWCVTEKGGKVYFQSARNGRFLFSTGAIHTSVVSNDHQPLQTQWEVSLRGSCS